MSGLTQDKSLKHVRGRVAGILLESAGNRKPGEKLTQRDMATALGIGWDAVNQSLKSLYAEGLIRMEYNRIIIRPELLRQVIVVEANDKLG